MQQLQSRARVKRPAKGFFGRFEAVGSVGARSHGRTSGKTTNYSLPLQAAHISNGINVTTNGLINQLAEVRMLTAGAMQKMKKGIDHRHHPGEKSKRYSSFFTGDGQYRKAISQSQSQILGTESHSEKRESML
jgi:hypothetical protein